MAIGIMFCNYVQEPQTPFGDEGELCFAWRRACPDEHYGWHGVNLLANGLHKVHQYVGCGGCNII
jgi:hypothetical protein